MKKNLMVIVFIGVFFTGFGQSKIDSIKVYMYYKSPVHNFPDGTQSDTVTSYIVKLSKMQVDSVCLILDHSHKEVRFENSNVIANIYLLLYESGVVHYFHYDFDSLIVDLTTEKLFRISNTIDIAYLKKLFKKYLSSNIDFNKLSIE